MTPADWDKVEALFHRALEIPEADRPAFLDRECPAGLRDEVDSLLTMEVPSRTLLNALPSRLAADVLERHPGGLLPGQHVSHYEIRNLMTQGGMGEVYLARDLRNGAAAVLKILRPHLIANEIAVTRFETEARAASALRHPNIVSIYEFGQSPQGLFIAMEWVEGITWRAMIKRGLAPLCETLNRASQAAAALGAAHAAGILHRDIKPENIMLRGDGVVKILDFGLARLADGQRRVPALSDVSIAGSSGTITGTLSGTLLYMSPEILRGEPSTEASDVFSLGAVLYELATGVHPFAGETPLDVFEAIECRAVQAASFLRGEIPPAVDELLLGALNRNPALRPSAAEIADRLSKSSTTP